MITSKEIQRLLPHRPPMLLVDRVADAVPGERITAFSTIARSEVWDPVTDADSAVYPQTLLVESWAQAAAVLVGLDTSDAEVPGNRLMLLGAASEIEFHRPARLGDVVEHRVRILRALSDTVMVEGESVVGEDTVVTVRQMVMLLRPAEQLRVQEGNRQ
ncbi:3-hydroxyacyl-ACP dehydratase FabZ family protein [Streptosporangium sp. NPDC000396]|uniref:3-hydroxyacyl-ACP dehydratase FabZ family protein n=1 Tax=Streptosporangium sp. NPDC000396 TaxID=3366185 RepID=UPI0036CB9DA8